MFAENYTLHKLTLHGGWVEGRGSTVTVAKGGLVQGYGGFVFGPVASLKLDNEGTINSNIKGQSLNIFEMPFENDGLVLASGGGNILIDWHDHISPLICGATTPMALSVPKMAARSI